MRLLNKFLKNSKDSSTQQLARILWDYNFLDWPLKKVDVIIVLGGNDLRLPKLGADLFLKGYAPLIIASGKRGCLTRGWKKTEAEVFAEVLTSQGISDRNLLVEKRAENTGENILFSKKLLKKKNITPNSVMLVTKPYMERRAYATACKAWPEVDTVVASPKIDFDNYPNKFISKDDIINALVGYTQRILKYPEKGFQITQTMPAKVEQAMTELMKRGYTRDLI